MASENLGLEPTLPYLSPLLVGERLLVGANFASAGIGILNDIGFQFLHIIHIYKQLKLFAHYQQRLSAHIGEEGALVLITLGGNDFVNNYYLLPYSLRSRQFSLPDYVTYIISEYCLILRRLYDLGTRRVLITGTGPMGSVPAELALRGGNGVNQEIGAHVFIAVNAYEMHMDFVTNPQAFGPFNGVGLCTPLSNLCPNRDLYAFWDPFQPSEKANRIIVQQMMTGSALPKFCYLMMISSSFHHQSQIALLAFNFVQFQIMASSSVFTSYIVLSLVMALAISGFNFKGAEAARAFFVFGDSLVDNGNNNYLATTARADAPPYGIDYPTRRPTGRQELGSESTLPYLSPELNGERLLVGANFASAGIGILNDTGVQFVNIIRITRQLEYFQEYQQRVSALVGDEKTKELVNGALVLITCGGNDFVNNYYLVPNSARSRQFALPDYVTYVISEYKKVLRRLYDLGARRVLVTGTGPLGCVPAELALRGRNGECSEELQRASALYNPQLVEMIKQLNKEVGSDVFVAANTQLMHDDFVTNPQAYGFITSKVACCGQGPFNGLGLCTVVSNLCPNRHEFAFWDPFHPSEKANRLIVQQIMSGTSKYMHPMNLSTILALDSKKY
ncbi:GDSL esterase/lipase [Glycine soja]